MLEKRACMICGVALQPFASRRPTCISPACEHALRVQAATPGKRRCTHCGKPIPPMRAGEVCADPLCEREQSDLRERARKSALAVEEYLKAQHLMLSRYEAEVRARAPGAIPEGAVRAVLPSNDRGLTAMTPERRAALAARLGELLAEIGDEEGAPAPPEPVGDATVSAREAITVSACMACRGQCCTGGKERAYLSAATLRRWLTAHPGASAAELVDDYLGRVQPETYEGSCIYHTATGCSLPRSMRSDTCNVFFCGDIRTLRAAVPEEQVVPVFVLLRGEKLRSALLDDRGFTPLAEAEREG